LGASNEKLAIEHLQSLDIDTMSIAAYGKKGLNPAAQLSFLVTDDLSDTISLEDYCGAWADTPPTFQKKKILLERLALISKTMHESGMNHRDYYLCHFLMAKDTTATLSDKPLYLIDLHRAQLRAVVPKRWKVKDIGGLYYSALNIGLTGNDVLRFVKCYSGKSLRQTFSEDKSFWSDVKSRAATIYKRDFGELPRFPL
jgi:heptose I phosphotransferase